MIHTTTSPFWPQLNGRSQRVANSVSLPERRTLLRTRSPSFSQELGCGFGHTRSHSSSPVAASGALGLPPSARLRLRAHSVSLLQPGCGFGHSVSLLQPRTRLRLRAHSVSDTLRAHSVSLLQPRTRLRLRAHSVSLLQPRTRLRLRAHSVSLLQPKNSAAAYGALGLPPTAKNSELADEGVILCTKSSPFGAPPPITRR